MYTKEENLDRYNERKSARQSAIIFLLAIFGTFSVINCILIYYFIEILKNN